MDIDGSLPNRIRILLVDDQSLFAEGLKFVLESRASDIEVVDIALNGDEAVRKAESLLPDIILMDVRMPVKDGVQAAREILAMNRKLKIVMLTTFDDDEYVQAALKNGAIGYLLKNRPPIELIYSIRAVQKGIVQLDPRVAESLFQRGEDSRSATEILRLIEDFTKREREVLHLLAQALDNRQIADHLHVAEQTVRNYIHSIYSKLGISNRMEIVRVLRDIDLP